MLRKMRLRQKNCFLIKKTCIKVQLIWVTINVTNMIFVMHFENRSVVSWIHHTPESRKVNMACNVPYLIRFIIIQARSKNLKSKSLLSLLLLGRRIGYYLSGERDFVSIYSEWAVQIFLPKLFWSNPFQTFFKKFWCWTLLINPLSTNRTKWSNTLKQLFECGWPLCAVAA